MASLVLGVVGAGIGTSFGMPEVGWLIGSTLGAHLFAEDTEIQRNQTGPRLSDLKVQAATYGQPIPLVFGSMRIAGNMLWSAGIKEHKHVTTSSQSTGGGKGGGGGTTVTTTSTTYTYSASFAVGLCEGPIDGVRRIWADGKLIYDVSTTNNGAVMSGTLGNVRTGAFNFRVYSGDESQQADPTIAADVGADVCPAYRGLAYVVFRSLPLADYGNRLPNLTFEVVKTGDGAQLIQDSVNWEDDCGNSPCHPIDVYDPYSRYIIRYSWSSDTGVKRCYRINPFTNEVRDVPGAGTAGYESWASASPANGEVWVVGIGQNGSRNEVARINAAAASGDYKIDIQPNPFVYATQVGTSRGIINNPEGPGVWMFTQAGWSTQGVHNYSLTLVKAGVGVVEFYAMPTGDQNYYWSGNGACYNPLTHTIWISSWIGLTVFSLSSRSVVMTVSAAKDFPLYDPITESVWAVDNDTIKKLDPYTGAVIGTIDGHAPMTVVPVSNSLYHRSHQNHTLVRTDLNDLTQENLGVQLQDSGNNLLYIPELHMLTNGNRVFKLDRTATSGELVSDVIGELVERSGLEQSDFSAEAVSETVLGYTVARPMPTRQALEPLLQAFQIDATDTGSLLHFNERGASVVRTLSSDDLGAGYEGEDVPADVHRTRTQELELPREIRVVHHNVNDDFQEGVQVAQRATGDANQSLDITLPVAMTPSQARQTAERLLAAAWAERERLVFTTLAGHADLESGDPIMLPLAGDSNRVRIIQREHSLPGLMRFEALTEYVEGYASEAIGEDGLASGSSISLSVPTVLLLLDIPLLQDQDNNPGFYFICYGVSDGWVGCQILMSDDSGTTWQSVATHDTEATAGISVDALPAGPTLIRDRINSVTIALAHGELYSDTEQNVFNYRNAALIGDEIVQWETAMLNPDGTYTLSNLLRGRRGTEWATSTHQAGERFVLLDAAFMGRITQQQDELNSAYLYQAPSFDQFQTQALAQSFNNTGRSLKPLSPVHAKGSRSAGGELTITFEPRTRLSPATVAYQDAPLGEDTESYEIDILNGSTVLRTIEVGGPEAVYSVADQMTDFGSVQPSIDVHIYQLSAVVGRGYVNEATL